MPLIKRKPVELVPPPRRDEYDLDTPMFYLRETGEIFPDFEDYSQRLSFYRQRIFQCELSGRIHLTFFEALKSERKQSALVHRQFPEPLKGPILRAVQFHLTGRIDELVDLVFDRFRDRFYQDETVVLDIHGDRFIAAVRGVHPSRSLTKRREEEDAAFLVKEEDGEEKTSLATKDIAHIIGTDLNRDESEAQKEDHPIDDYLYSVQLLSADGEDDFSMARMERRADSLARDRLSFSKTILKKYLKECVVRDASIGSPWIVKPLLAEKYGIPMKMPDDVEEKNRLLKAGKLSKRRKYLDDLAASSEDGAKNKKRKTKADEDRVEVEQKDEEALERERRKKLIKYPIDDLQLEDDADQSSKRPVPQEIPVKCFEPLMNSYLFLQACGKALQLSPFHLDDFELGLRHETHDPPCHMIGEVHATLLNVIVRDLTNQKVPVEKDVGEEEEEEEEEDEFDEEKNATDDEMEDEQAEEDDEEDELDELDSKASSVKADSDLESSAGDEDEVAAEGEDRKREKRLGEEVYVAGRKLGRGWESKTLRSDNFRAGWEYSLCGLLTKRATPELFPRALAILSHLTGVAMQQDEDGEEGVAATETDMYQTPVHRYPTLAFEDKVLVLQFLCEQAVLSRTIKRFFDQCEHHLTELRKERVELGRARRKLAEDRNTFEEGLAKDEEEEGEGEGEGADRSGNEEGDENENSSVTTKGAKPKANGKDNHDDETSGGEDDELASTDGGYDSSATENKIRRNFGSRQEAMRIKALQREAEEAERAARQRQEREEQKARQMENRQIALERKRMDDEEARINKREEAIDREFRQHSQAPRLTPLGRDRFLDKYWWFDGVGAASLVGPHGQVQYSTGRLFVQGPSEEEWSALAQEFAPGEEVLSARKRADYSEEGTLGYDQWRVYSEPEEVDALVTWLRAKGIRELGLRQQLHKFRQYIQPGMQKRSHDLTGGWKDNVETRRSNRTKDNAASRPPFMNYRNAFLK